MATDEGTLRPELKTWRLLNVLHPVIVQALAAAEAEGLMGQVAFQLREAGLYVAAALATLEVLKPDDDGLTSLPTTAVPLTIVELSQLIAVVTGARDRTAQLPSTELLGQLDGMRDKLIAADMDLRDRMGLPVD